MYRKSIGENVYIESEERMVTVKTEVLFKDMPPLDSPECNFPGLMQGEKIYKKGTVTKKGRRPMPCDILCDSDREFVIGRKRLTVYADIYRPATNEQVPAIICWGYGGKRDTNNKIENIKLINKDGSEKKLIGNDKLSGLQGWESLDPAQWVPDGYAIVNVDPPGVNYSEGNLLLFGSEDSENGCDFIEQIAAEPWCTGKVAMAGSSWYAMVQLFFASQNPPHLTAIAPFESEADLYRDEYVRGGMGLTPPAFSIGFRTHGRNQIEDIGAMIEKYPLMNDYWEDKIIHHENINIPAYIVGSYTSWYHTRGTPKAYQNISSEEKWYRTHLKTEWIDLYGDYYQSDLKKFFDHYLKDEDNGWEDTPPVRLGLFNPGGENIENRPESQYPPENMIPEIYYLDLESGVLMEEVSQKLTQAIYDDDDPESILLDLTFSERTEIIGPSKLKIWLEALDSDDADIFVRYFKIDENKNKIICDDGWAGYIGPEGRLRASHRELDEEKSTLLEPVQKHKRMLRLEEGEIVPLEIQIWPTGMIFEKGQTLRLEITGRDFTADRPPNMIALKGINKGRCRILSGAGYDSQLVLPVCR